MLQSRHEKVTISHVFCGDLRNHFRPRRRAPKGVNLAQMQGWDIVVAQDAIASETYAAEEFQTLFNAAGGPKLPIVASVDRATKHAFIGPSVAFWPSVVASQSA